ncbi:hypothetical protein [Acidiphilium iwatense]|uniref:Uncharacterized protein n=1 Tax=Acidiphilium iwatense TaxID=768198 RepID=A0ABS9DZQ4_9PROT|nr:hypothetical protein [Acidiphilium iwatense]MCF3948244.1 hypothetical protein [Acidiphilium iwatense]
MIPITPEILGPGIEEEYADAMERIDFLSEAFKDYPASNDTPHGPTVCTHLFAAKNQPEKISPKPD